MDFGGGDQIRFERKGVTGLVTLTRPKALNALTHAMVTALARALAAWEDDPDVAAVIVQAEGRAFCAGGDLRAVRDAVRAGALAFFADEYRLNAQIRRLAKPHVALIDGICMGGGMGISVHGAHRVMTENAVFAMPEVGIGFFPDVGGSHVLPRLGGHFGIYLGLTGSRIGQGDALASGIATHALAAADLPALVEAIAAGGDPGPALRARSGPAPRGTGDRTRDAIARHFSLGSLQEIVASLERDATDDGFAAETLATLRARCPTSLHVTFRALAAGSTLSMDDCLRMEYRILHRMLSGHDFHEGIRTALIDRGAAPQWRPACLAEVSEAAVDAYFAPLPDGELAL